MRRSLTAVLLGTFTLRFSTGLTGALLVYYLAELQGFGADRVTAFAQPDACVRIELVNVDRTERRSAEAIIRREGDKLIIEAAPPKSLLALLSELPALEETLPDIDDAPPSPVSL